MALDLLRLPALEPVHRGDATDRLPLPGGVPAAQLADEPLLRTPLATERA
jgi:hypothetical protein